MKNYLTKSGYDKLTLELKHIVTDLRPKLVEVVAWAASNGDRSENGDYIYGKRKLREYDRRIEFLTKLLKTVTVVNPTEQSQKDKIFFGATVTYEVSNGNLQTIQIVGSEEADPKKGLINYQAPLAKSLLLRSIGDITSYKTANGIQEIEITNIKYI